MIMNKLKTFWIVLPIVLESVAVSCSSEDVDEVASGEVNAEAVGYAVTPEEAVEIARNALEIFQDSTNGRSKESPRKVASLAGRKCKARASSDSTATSSFYIVNFEGGGFAVVSSDKRATEIYAISDEGSFDEESNEGVKSFMEAAEVYQSEEIAASTASTVDLQTFKSMDDIINPYLTVTIDGVTYNMKTETTYSNSPFYLLKTIWNQGSPYNYKCPIIDGQNAKTGCVPIAVAQIAAYHKQPQEYNGHTYYWDSILESEMITSNSDDKALSAAELIHDIGVLAGTKYGAKSSSTSKSNVYDALKGLGYSYDKMRSFNFSSVKSSVANDCPVYMRGKDEGEDSGHAWVVDGYYTVCEKYTYYKLNTWEVVRKGSSERDYIHCNWGWGGTSDGYFFAEVLNPTASSGKTYTYSEDLEIITNIKYE